MVKSVDLRIIQNNDHVSADRPFILPFLDYKCPGFQSWKMPHRKNTRSIRHKQGTYAEKASSKDWGEIQAGDRVDNEWIRNKAKTSLFFFYQNGICVEDEVNINWLNVNAFVVLEKHVHF